MLCSRAQWEHQVRRILFQFLLPPIQFHLTLALRKLRNIIHIITDICWTNWDQTYVRNELINLVYFDNKLQGVRLITLGEVTATEARFSLVIAKFTADRMPRRQLLEWELIVYSTSDLRTHITDLYIPTTVNDELQRRKWSFYHKEQKKSMSWFRHCFVLLLYLFPEYKR